MRVIVKSVRAFLLFTLARCALFLVEVWGDIVIGWLVIW